MLAKLCQHCAKTGTQRLEIMLFATMGNIIFCYYLAYPGEGPRTLTQTNWRNEANNEEKCQNCGPRGAIWDYIFSRKPTQISTNAPMEEQVGPGCGPKDLRRVPTGATMGYKDHNDPQKVL